MATPQLNIYPTAEEVNEVLTPLEEAEERDYEEMLCALYESHDDITDNFNDARYWI